MAPRPIRRPPTRVGWLLTATVLGAAGLLASCGSSASDADGPAVVSDEAAAVESTTSTTTTAAPADTAPAAPIGLFSPQETAQALYDAWKADDRATAATLAEPAAVEGQWLTAPGDYRPYNECDSGEFGTSGCLFRGAGGTIQYSMERREDRWVATAAFFSAP